MAAIHIRQRADLTHKHNLSNGRHGWLRLTPAYSVKVVNEIIDTWPQGTHILDPFSGTATTPLCAASHGYMAIAVDINPFLIWFGRAKVATYTKQERENAYQLAEQLLNRISQRYEFEQVAAVPPLYNIERWWDQRALSFLSVLKTFIDESCANGSPAHTLLQIAFCRTMIRLSNASFDHQSMSFKDASNDDCLQLSFYDTDSDGYFARLFREDLQYILETASDNPAATAEIVPGDARQVGQYINGTYDLIVTSPPYPNRMSYIRELRPYMYWLGYLQDAREAGELDWQAIGGTWGIATSRLLQWQKSNNTFYPPYFSDIVSRVSSTENANGLLLARYIEKYFEDIWSHLQSIAPLLTSKGEAHYIVGNSTFYGVLLPVERVYRDMMLELGFTDVTITVLRKRNSKKELFEYVVRGRKS